MTADISAMTDKLRRMRIGYVPIRSDLKAPGDRRRFCYYAAKRGLSFELADPSRTYDLVILSQLADITAWSRYRKGKIAFDLIDSYLAIPPRDVKGALRGIAKFAVRQSRYLQLSFRRSVEEMCRRSDLVICSTVEQKRDIEPFCRNVHVVLDFHTEDVRRVKTDYRAGRMFNLVWEGLPPNLAGFQNIASTLRDLNKQRPLALHLITDLTYRRFMGKVGDTHTVDVVRKLNLPAAYLYQWNDQMMATIATSCDLALIPLAYEDPFAFGKPENKLLLFWRMAVPVLTASTPAYRRAMDLAKLEMTWSNESELRGLLEHYMSDESARAGAGAAGHQVSGSFYSEESTLAKWDSALESLL